MKEIVNLRKAGSILTKSEMSTAVITHIIVAVIAFIASRAVILKSFVPFGISVLAGCPSVFTASAAIGAFIGYFIPMIDIGIFRYIAAVFALLSIKMLLSAYKKLIENPIFLSSVCLLINVVTAFIGNSASDDIPLYLAEALLSAGGAFFVAKVGRAVKAQTVGFSAEEMASFIVLITILLLGLIEIEAGGIYLAHILAVLLILSAAKFGGTLSGAVSGISVAFCFTISGNSSEIAVTYALGGMMAGIFSSLGKYAQVTAVILSAFTGVAAIGINLSSISFFIEIIIGSVLFLLLPRNIGATLGKYFSAYPKVTPPTSIKKSITMRLNMASNALNDVSETVEQVSRELGKINTPDFSTVINRIEQEACSGCKLRLHCWETKKSETVESVFDMTKAVKNGDLSPELTAPENFRGRCLRLGRMGAAVSRHYSDYASKLAAENRIDEVRSVVTDQFDGISKMLRDLSEDFKNDEKFDNSTALSAAAALKNLNLCADECNCRIDKYGRMTLEFRIRKNNEQRINKMHIMKLLSIVCDRDFDVPTVSEIGNDIYLTLNERTAFRVDFGAEQLSASNTSMCGDAYNCFNDGKGHFIIILSDGMGTGGRAAVDGAMASGLMMRLLKAGFGYDCSLKILNSSMLFKSTDESLATIDIVSIDLYTGEVELYKAGAAPTLVRRLGRTGKAESRSLPAGILRDIGFDYANLKMKSGDIVLIMSDGAISDGTDWIRAELENFKDGNANDLASHICESAHRRSSDKRPDDITVIAAILEKKV